MREHQRPALKLGRNMFRRVFLQLAFLSVVAAAQAQLIPGSPTPPPRLPPPSDGDASQALLEKIPPDTILVKGAEPSASDHSTPLPEEGSIAKNIYRNRYLDMTLPLPADFTEPFEGPPPSDSGKYVLAQLVPASSFKGPVKGTILISAQDTFFSLIPTRNAVEMIRYTKEHLPSYYEVEHAPADAKFAGRNFVRFDYKSPVANLHWYVLATEVRCHVVEFVFTSQDTTLLERLVTDLNTMELPGGSAPVCIANYATPANITYKVDPILADRRFNQIPVRIIIDKNGRVRHVHLISAYPDQAAKITEALLQWTFKPYMRNGQAVEVETGIMFRSTKNGNDASRTAASTND